MLLCMLIDANAVCPPWCMKQQLQHILEASALSKKEAALYMAGLALGAAPASAYAAKARMNRVTAYTTLEHMVRRGLCTAVRRDRAKWYAPVSPEALALEARKNVDALERALPELRSLRGAEHREPMVSFYGGWDGVRHVYEHTLTASGEILNFANSATVRAHWECYDDEYIAERVRRGIHLRGIAPDDRAGRGVQGRDSESLREIRLVPATDFDFDNEINIYDSTVAITSFGRDPADMFGVVIESREVAETQRQIFEMAWRYAGMLQRLPAQ